MRPPCAKRRRIAVEDQPIRNETIHPEMDWNKETRCRMCGSSGHLASLCPSACCLKCGEKTVFFQDECSKCVIQASKEASTVCEICGYRGHSKYNCPNLWKCFHSTIDMTSESTFSMLESPRNVEFNRKGSEQTGGSYECFRKATEPKEKSWS